MNQPFSKESEVGVLGSALSDTRVFSYLKSETDICAESFYEPIHADIWTAMEELHSAGRPIDPRTVVGQLKTTGNLERVGGFAAVTGIADDVLTSAHVESYAAEVSRCAGLRAVLKASSKMTSAALAPDALNGQEVAAKGIADLVEVLKTREAETTIEHEANLAVARWDEAVAIREAGGKAHTSGIPCGLQRIDGLLDGLQPGLIVLGARQSTGKTAMCGQIVGNMLKAGLPVLRITRDSLRARLIERDIAREAYMNLSSLSKGYMKALERERVIKAKEAVSRWPVRIETRLWKIQDITAAIRADVQKRGTRFVSIDYVQLLSAGSRATDNDRNGKLEVIMGELKKLVFDIGIPILILSQLARDKEGLKGRCGNFLHSRPIMEDMRDSGSLEQLADVVILLSKVDDIHDENMELGRRSLLAFDIAKNKQGPTDTIMLQFHRPYFTFEEITENQQDAVMKALKDDGKKLDKIKQPYFESIQDAMNRSHLMEEKK
jgi:replicative DNA helicase